MDLVYLVKRGYYYRQNWAGYTASRLEAGQYSREVAERHASQVEGVTVEEMEKKG